MKWIWLMRAAGKAALEDQLLDWAAALSFYFLFALFPGMLLLAVLLSSFHLESLTMNLVAALSRNLPLNAATLVSQQLQDLLLNHVPGLVSIDVLLLLYSASRGFSGLMVGLNAAYEVQETRPYWFQLLLSLALLFSAGILIALALAFLVLGQRIFVIVAGPSHAQFALSFVWPLLRWSLTLGFMVLAVVMLYRFAPNVNHRARGLFPAVLSAMVLWVIASALLAVYVNHWAEYSAVYGSLGAVIALMLWFYLFAFALLFGAEIHNEWLKQRSFQTAAGEVPKAA